MLDSHMWDDVGSSGWTLERRGHSSGHSRPTGVRARRDHSPPLWAAGSPARWGRPGGGRVRFDASPPPGVASRPSGGRP
jgi:hypothetical protein